MGHCTSSRAEQNDRNNPFSQELLAPQPAGGLGRYGGGLGNDGGGFI